MFVPPTMTVSGYGILSAYSQLTQMNSPQSSGSCSGGSTDSPSIDPQLMHKPVVPAIANLLTSTSAQLYAVSTFSTVPFPPSSPPPLSTAAASASAFMKQQRVSLALPFNTSPRIFPTRSFRDETGLGVRSPDSAQAPDDAADAKEGKVRRIAGGDDAPDAGDMTMNMNMGVSNGSWPPTTVDDEQREAGEEAPEEVDDGGDADARRWMQQGA